MITYITSKYGKLSEILSPQDAGTEKMSPEIRDYFIDGMK